MKRFISFALLAVVYEAAIASGQKFNKMEATIKANEPLTIRCEVEGFTSIDSIRWKKNGDFLKVDEENGILIDVQNSTESNITIKDAEFGNYSCVVTLKNGKTFEEAVELTEAAYVEPFEKNKNLVQEDRLLLECSVRGSPTPTVSWSKDDADLSKHKTIEYQPNTKGIANATLIIPRLEFEDRGIYACIAENKINGNHFASNATVTVRVKDKLAALWPFLGICAEVAILCTIIFIFEKRRAKKMQEEEAKEEAGHLTNSYDNQKAEVRQRKS